MRIIVTGAAGFIGKNLCMRLRELEHDVRPVVRDTTTEEIAAELGRADFVFHLAGVNRPTQESEFHIGNTELTERLCNVMAASGRATPIVYTSSSQAALDNPYGRSKRAAEEAVLGYAQRSGARVHVLRLPNVFGKWSRPHYNSVVATFCHQIARGLPITVKDAALRLLYIDDLVTGLVDLLTPPRPDSQYVEIGPVYSTTVSEVADWIRKFAESRHSLSMPPVGTGLVRALYATYVSHLPTEAFAYQVPRHADPRGTFVEMLKTAEYGQFSYFTARPGVTRGEHYHHTKTEKFLVVHGTALFRFRNIDTGDLHEVTARGGEGRIVESIPGWAHNVINTGDDELIVILWANEIFDRARPDTVAMKVAT